MNSYKTAYFKSTTFLCANMDGKIGCKTDVSNTLATRCQFHQHFTCPFFVQNCVLRAAFFYLHVTREKLLKRLLYEKVAPEMLMKLTPASFHVVCGHTKKLKILLLKTYCSRQKRFFL